MLNSGVHFDKLSDRTISVVELCQSTVAEPVEA